MRVMVEVYDYMDDAKLFRKYVMDHDDPIQRRVLGEQCRNAFEGDQMVVTYPLPDKENRK